MREAWVCFAVSPSSRHSSVYWRRQCKTQTPVKCKLKHKSWHGVPAWGEPTPHPAPHLDPGHTVPELFRDVLDLGLAQAAVSLTRHFLTSVFFVASVEAQAVSLGGGAGGERGRLMCHDVLSLTKTSSLEWTRLFLEVVTLSLTVWLEEIIWLNSHLKTVLHNISNNATSFFLCKVPSWTHSVFKVFATSFYFLNL